ncbi:Apt Adenine/guanine phosphoribosyltransferases and related PRPP-binding proteins [Candidatus Nanopelagicaceae bacterium]|jgi:adenine phosphoribosyltransferase
MKIDDALSLIREIPDYPQPGIRFQDITPLLAHGEAFIAITEKFATYADSSTLVAGIEARGFIFASAVANQLRSGFVPIRKAGKLPHLTISESYGLEYGVDTLELHIDAITPGANVLLIDDVLATGGTIAAAIELIQRLGGKVIHVLALLEIEGLPGRERLNQKYPEIPVTSLVVS